MNIKAKVIGQAHRHCDACKKDTRLTILNVLGKTIKACNKCLQAVIV